MFGRLLSVIGLSARKKDPKYEQFLIIRSSCFISYVEMIYFPLFSFRNLTLFVISMRKLSKCNLILAFSLSLSIRTSLCPSPFLFYLRTVYYDIVKCCFLNGREWRANRKKKTKSPNRDGTFYLRLVWPAQSKLIAWYRFLCGRGIEKKWN